MGVLHHLPGQLNVLLQGQGGAVDHHGGVAPLNGGGAGIEVLAVVQVENDGDGGVRPVLLHGGGDVPRALLLVLQGALGEVHPAAHEGVGQIRPLENGEGLVHLNDGLGLGHGVHVKGPLGVIVLLGGLHQGPQRY